MAVALAAATLVLTWQALTVRYNYGGNWTALFCTGASFTVPPPLAAGTYRFAHTAGYDGQFYRYVAHDPFFRRGYAAYIDNPPFRCGRILVPLAAYALALGRQEWIDGAFVAVVLASIFLGVYWTARYAALHGRHPAWGLLFLAVPATVTSIDRMLLDAALTALFAGYLVAAERRQWRTLYVLSVLACLTKETGLLLPAGYVLSCLGGRRWAAAARFAATAVPALGWYAFVFLHAPALPSAQQFSYPVVGVLARLFTARPLPDPVLGPILQVTDALAVLGLLGSFALAALWAWRFPVRPVAISVALFLAMGLATGQPAHMLEAFGYARPVSPLLLFVMLQAVVSVRWVGLAAPLAITLNVCQFLGYQLIGVVRGLFF
jgi:hypothetical protein